MAEQGADILDIGAESTRPYGGAQAGIGGRRTGAARRRCLPAVVELGLPVSIDTIKAPVAAWALDQGAAIVNDVWGLQRDPDMAPLVAERGVPVIVMHNRERADPRIDIIADVDRLLRPLARHRRAAPASRASRSCSTPASASARRRSRASSASRGLPSSSASACRSWSAPRASASSTACRPRSPDERIGGSIAAHVLAVAKRRRDHARARRGRDRAGAARRRRDRGRAMSDRIFINGLALHAYHGVMPHEGKVGQTLHHRPCARHRPHARRRAPTRWPTRCPTTRWWTCASEAFCRAEIPADRGRRRRGGRRGAGGISRACAQSR